MNGYNVMFPQGWDCHGLPTEVKVEETHGITKNDVPRDEFRRMCRGLTLGNIEKMRRTLRRMGFSVDWSHEYITMLPAYYGKTQLSFLRMLNSGYIYQSEHPVNFCTRCETAIAFAEVWYEDRETVLNFFDFDGVEIATSRPELLAACVAVAVHPEDERYGHLKGRTLKVPIFCHEVPVIIDEAVDPGFGSGAVMICTFGDKQDVHWWKQHSLDLRKAIDKSGRMTAIAGKYAGMKPDECRKAIVADMTAGKILKRTEPLQQRVGTCWRCKTPIEILSERQWFVKIVPGGDHGCGKGDLLEPAAHVPAHGKLGGTDGMGLVHLPAADLRHPHPGLVLCEVRGDDPPGRAGPPRRSYLREAPRSMPVMRVRRDLRGRRRSGHLDGLFHMGPERYRLGRQWGS